MDKLHSLFHENIQTLYSAKEMSEVLRHLYVLIEIAIYTKTNKLKITPFQILHLDKDDNIIKESIAASSRFISNVDVLDLIISRDSIVRDHLELIARDDNEVVYKIT